MPFLLYNLVRVIDWLINLIVVLIVVRALLSWFPMTEGGSIRSFLDTLTEPVVGPIRGLLNKIKFTRELPIDFSPIIAIMILFFIKDILNALVVSFA